MITLLLTNHTITHWYIIVLNVENTNDSNKQKKKKEKKKISMFEEIQVFCITTWFFSDDIKGYLTSNSHGGLPNPGQRKLVRGDRGQRVRTGYGQGICFCSHASIPTPNSRLFVGHSHRRCRLPFSSSAHANPMSCPGIRNCRSARSTCIDRERASGASRMQPSVTLNAD